MRETRSRTPMKNEIAKLVKKEEAPKEEKKVDAKKAIKKEETPKKQTLVGSKRLQSKSPVKVAIMFNVPAPKAKVE